MGYVIDSSVLIGYERRFADLRQLSADDPSACYCISVISVSELRHGYERATTDMRRRHRLDFLNGILEAFEVLTIDVETAHLHARIWSELETRGEMIGIHDSWIAASCLRHGHALVTANAKEFQRVNGLVLAV